ncbi:MAG TPA: zinc ribbon domain-containing protein [Gaiellales bacterium]|jgi:hypothetical protein
MYCGKCGAARAEGDSFCPRCGAAYAAEEPGAGAGFSSPVAPADPASDDTPFSGEMTLAAFLLAIFMPFIALIAALVMRSSEQRPSRRQFLKTWAIVSGAWLATGWIVALLLFVSVAGSIGSGGGGCKGAPDPFGLPEYTSTDGKHWTAIVPCTGGGTTTRPAKPGEVPGGSP